MVTVSHTAIGFRYRCERWTFPWGPRKFAPFRARVWDGLRRSAVVRCSVFVSVAVAMAPVWHRRAEHATRLATWRTQ